jgi:hypothetical protein
MGWHAMHKPKAKGEVDMSGIHEVRDRHKDVLYRLYCVVDRNAPDHGLAMPSVVVLDGAMKPVGTEMSQSVYKRIDEYRRDYDENHRIVTRPKRSKKEKKRSN